MNTHVDPQLGRRLPQIKPGRAALPLSKSMALRGLVVAAGLQRSAELASASPSAWNDLGGDLSAGISCAGALGAEISINGPSLKISPGQVTRAGALSVGESGFLGRVVPICAALGRGGDWVVEAKGTLRDRASEPLWDCVRGAGARLGFNGSWVSELSAPAEFAPLDLCNPVSSQELSALLIGLAACGGGDFKVEGEIPSRPYLEMTASVLRSFGFEVSESAGSFRVEGFAVDPEAPLLVEVDASAAAVALAAGCLSGVRVDVPVPLQDSVQGDWRIVEHLRAFGCEIEESEERLVAAGPPVHSVDLDLAGEPDLAPVLAIIAAAAALRGAGPSSLRGLETLDKKESARGAVLSSGLRDAGFQCDWSGSSLKIYGRPSSSAPVSLNAFEDHRMGFAFSLLGIICPNVWVAQGSCIQKSWPGFWSSMVE